jgi:hypothetical protein
LKNVQLICNKNFLKQEFRFCDRCKTSNCLNCIIKAGKLGKIRKKCYKKPTEKEREQYIKAANKLKFWAKFGYYIFIIFIIITFFSFSLFYLNAMLG